VDTAVEEAQNGSDVVATNENLEIWINVDSSPERPQSGPNAAAADIERERYSPMPPPDPPVLNPYSDSESDDFSIPTRDEAAAIRKIPWPWCRSLVPKFRTGYVYSKWHGRLLSPQLSRNIYIYERYWSMVTGGVHILNLMSLFKDKQQLPEFMLKFAKWYFDIVTSCVSNALYVFDLVHDRGQGLLWDMPPVVRTHHSFNMDDGRLTFVRWLYTYNFLNPKTLPVLNCGREQLAPGFGTDVRYIIERLHYRVERDALAGLKEKQRAVVYCSRQYLSELLQRLKAHYPLTDYDLADWEPVEYDVNYLHVGPMSDKNAAAADNDDDDDVFTDRSTPTRKRFDIILNKPVVRTKPITAAADTEAKQLEPRSFSTAVESAKRKELETDLTVDTVVKKRKASESHFHSVGNVDTNEKQSEMEPKLRPVATDDIQHGGARVALFGVNFYEGRTSKGPSVYSKASKASAILPSVATQEERANAKTSHAAARIISGNTKEAEASSSGRAGQTQGTGTVHISKATQLIDQIREGRSNFPMKCKVGRSAIINDASYNEQDDDCSDSEMRDDELKMALPAGTYAYIAPDEPECEEAVEDITDPRQTAGRLKSIRERLREKGPEELQLEIEEEDKVCPKCCISFQESSDPIVKLDCSHRFHKKCIEAYWDETVLCSSRENKVLSLQYIQTCFRCQRAHGICAACGFPVGSNYELVTRYVRLLQVNAARIVGIERRPLPFGNPLYRLSCREPPKGIRAFRHSICSPCHAVWKAKLTTLQVIRKKDSYPTLMEKTPTGGKKAKDILVCGQCNATHIEVAISNSKHKLNTVSLHWRDFVRNAKIAKVESFEFALKYERCKHLNGQPAKYNDIQSEYVKELELRRSGPLK
jgi:hypothetical protein